MAVKHQDNFGTNLTSNQSPGVTTTPINSIPTVATPFYIALDATNINGSYEVVYVTSKTATNINHATTTNAHTTAEEVRLVLPSTELNTLVSPQQGFIFNGKISPTVSSNNLTVALKTLNGTDPSVTDPVWIRIGDTVRAITSALSVTKNAGTNWFNAGSTELATKEIDYFVYLGYNTTDDVVIGFSRIPYASQYDDFSVTTTNEKYCAISTITNAASTDYYEVIGRFAATLGVTATYLWTVPTYTSKNLIQKPIHETRPLNAEASATGFSSAPTSDLRYKLINNQIFWSWQGSGTSNATTFTYILPFALESSDAAYTFNSPVKVFDNGNSQLGVIVSTNGSSTITVNALISGSVFTSSGSKGITAHAMYSYI